MENLVNIIDGKPVTTSLKIAEVFGKEHRHVLESIRNLGAPEEFTEPNFRRSEYKDSTGRTLPMYLITRDGFTLLAMGFTGAKAMQFKLAYIEAFNKMEEELKAIPCCARSNNPSPAVQITPADLMASTVAMLDSLNRRVEAKENVPGHILKYAWNMANLTRTRSVVTPCHPDIAAVFETLPIGEKLNKTDIYHRYCDNCEGHPMSARSFWPMAKKAVKLEEIRTAAGRFIIIL